VVVTEVFWFVLEYLSSFKKISKTRIGVIISEGKTRVVEMSPTEEDITPYLHKREAVKSSTKCGIYDLHVRIFQAMLKLASTHNGIVCCLRNNI
jgi:hypothetical protein